AVRKAIEIDPLSGTAWSNVGRYLMFSRDYPAAGDALRRALEIQPDSVYALNDLGTVQLLEGKPVDALATFRKIGLGGLKMFGVAMAEHTLGHVNESQQTL